MNTPPSNLTTLVGAPLDSAGRPNGLERMPQALRAAGLAARLQLRDAGDLPVVIDCPQRDEATGIIGFQALRRASETIRASIGDLLARGERPLLVGGDCSLLIGTFAALRERFGRVGLAFVDGHLDCYGGHTSPTGEAADMDLAILLGFGPAGLTDLAGPPPLVLPGDVAVVGYRDAAQAERDGALDPGRVAPALR